jgi:hypothetical protein
MKGKLFLLGELLAELGFLLIFVSPQEFHILFHVGETVGVFSLA